MGFKKLQILICSSLLIFSVHANAENEKECFEKISRGVFKFNQGFDNVILEPVAKVYISCLNQVEKELVISLQI